MKFIAKIYVTYYDFDFAFYRSGIKVDERQSVFAVGDTANEAFESLFKDCC